MKTLIFQYYIGKDLPEWAQISKDRFKKYSTATNSDYFFTNSSTYSDNPYFENLRVVYDSNFDDYDRILYVDVDVIPENFTENIFEVDIKDIGMVPEYRPPGMNADPLFMLPNYELNWRHIALQNNIPVVTPKTVKANYLMFNSGVILWSKEGRYKARQRFSNWQVWNKQMNGLFSLDQPYLTGQTIKHLDYTELELKWNCFPRFRFYPDQIPANINFVHYTGGKKQMIKGLYGNEN